MDENKKLTEEQLNDVSGGNLIRTEKPKESSCYFTPDNSGNIRYAGGYYWKKCVSTCFGCFCHGKDWCVDKWHHVTGDGELIPRDRSNHKSKQKSNNYNT